TKVAVMTTGPGLIMPIATTAGCAQEIDRQDLGGTPLQPCELGYARRSFLTADPRAGSKSLREKPDRLCNLSVIVVPGGVEHCHDLLIREAIDETSRLRWDLVEACFSGPGHGVSLKHLNPSTGTDVSTTPSSVYQEPIRVESDSETK